MDQPLSLSRCGSYCDKGPPEISGDPFMEHTIYPNTRRTNGPAASAQNSPGQLWPGLCAACNPSVILPRASGPNCHHIINNSKPTANTAPPNPHRICRKIPGPSDVCAVHAQDNRGRYHVSNPPAKSAAIKTLLQQRLIPRNHFAACEAAPGFCRRGTAPFQVMDTGAMVGAGRVRGRGSVRFFLRWLNLR